MEPYYLDWRNNIIYEGWYYKSKINVIKVKNDENRINIYI